MTITWVVEKQTETRRVLWNNDISSACATNDLNFHEIMIVPFVHEIHGTKPTIQGPVIVHGSTAIIDVSNKEGWSPGVFRIYNESDTLKAIGDHYLNYDMKVLEVEEVVDYVRRSGMDFFFAKPDKDLKSFDGTVFDIDKYPFFMERIQQYANYDPDTKICVSSIKHPETEWRFVIVNGKVIAYSQYRVKRILDVKPYTEDQAIIFAEEIAKYASPADVFVMDVCKINGQYKVIEYNTFNCSGLYSCNVKDIVKGVSEYVTSINK